AAGHVPGPVASRVHRGGEGEVGARGGVGARARPHAHRDVPGARLGGAGEGGRGVCGGRGGVVEADGGGLGVLRGALGVDVGVAGGVGGGDRVGHGSLVQAGGVLGEGPVPGGVGGGGVGHVVGRRAVGDHEVNGVAGLRGPAHCHARLVGGVDGVGHG